MRRVNQATSTGMLGPCLSFARSLTLFFTPSAGLPAKHCLLVQLLGSSLKDISGVYYLFIIFVVLVIFPVCNSNGCTHRGMQQHRQKEVRRNRSSQTTGFKQNLPAEQNVFMELSTAPHGLPQWKFVHTCSNDFYFSSLFSNRCYLLQNTG